MELHESYNYFIVGKLVAATKPSASCSRHNCVTVFNWVKKLTACGVLGLDENVEDDNFVCKLTALP